MQVFVRTLFVGIILLFLVSIAQSAQAVSLLRRNEGTSSNQAVRLIETKSSTGVIKPAAAAATPVAITPKIVSSFSVTDIPANRAQTITWANGGLWLADVNSNVYRLSQSGVALQPSFPITFTPYGLAWDGSSLWSGDGSTSFGSWQAFQLNSVGKVNNVLGGTWDTSNIHDLAWVGNFLYASDNSSQSLIHKLDRTGKHILSWRPDFPGYVRGMAYDGTGLWIGENCFGDARNDLHRYTLLGQHLDSIDLNAIGIACSFNTQHVRGLAWDGRFLWYTADDTFTVYKLDVGIPDLAVSPTQLAFGPVPLNSTAAQTITVQNTGLTNLLFSGITVSKDFAQTNTCPTGATTLAGGASCTIRVTFKPVVLESRTGAITITNYADVTPHVVSLTGSGTPNGNTYTLQVNTVGNGTVNLNPLGPYTQGQLVTLTATPDSGWSFTGWSGDLSGTTNPASFNISQNATVNANFTATSTTRCFTLTLTHTGSGSDPVATPANSPGCVTGQYTDGAVVNLSASPAGGWQVSGWTGTANNASTTTTNSLTMPPSNQTVSVMYTQGPPPSSAKTWTILIYAVGDNDLASALGAAPNGMLDRLHHAGPQANVQVGVLYDGPGVNDTVLYILSENGDWTPFERLEARMNDMTTLRDFIRWGFNTFQTDYYYLAIADHANGVVGIGQDDTSNGKLAAFLSPQDVSKALAQGASGRKFDIVQFDGCSFGLFEDTSIVQDQANYVIASPSTGWGIFAFDEYRKIAGQATNDPRTVAQGVAQHYAGILSTKGYPYTISVFDMAHWDAVRAAVDALGNQLAAYAKADSVNHQKRLSDEVRKPVQKYDSSGDYQIMEQDAYLDLRSMAVAVKALGETTLSSAADNVLNTTQPFIALERHGSGRFNGSNLVDLSGAQGLGIYYPYGQSIAYQHYMTDTNKIEQPFPNLSNDWGWRSFLRVVLPPPEPNVPLPEGEQLIPTFTNRQVFLPLVMR